MEKITVVIPLYNEEKRLNKLIKGIKNFNKAKINKSYEFIFVDDGSTDNTAKKISQFIDKIKKNKHKYKLIKSTDNFGKGNALKLGVKAAKNNWIFTMDADLSVDIFQTIKWFKKYSFKSDHAYFGSRNHPLSTQKYKYYRKFIGDTFQYLIFLFIDKNIKDTQCGFKLYKAKIAKSIFNQIYDNGFIHDVEVVLIASRENYNLKELPVKWIHKSNSKLNLFKDPIIMFIKLFILKKKY